LRYELRIAGRIETASSGRRRTAREIRKGIGMVTPIKPITVGWEIVDPGRGRFDPSHSAVRSRPDLFKPCCPEDIATGNRLLLALAARKHRGGLPAWARSSEPDRRWRLP
jgi:hypothetical protein